MRSHGKKMVGPIVAAALLILYYIVYFILLVTLLEGVWRVVLGVVPLAFAALTVWVCVERIREIRSGEEDDLSQY